MIVVVTAAGALGGLTLVLASLLALAERTLHVDEDLRIDAVEELLPHANCGACGYPGCRPFAEALVGGAVLPGKCSVGSAEDHVRIAAFLGVGVGAEEKRVARLACAGGANVARNHARYDGLMTCQAAALVAGGGKGCFWGCLGLADCYVACKFDAIHMDEQDLPVVSEDRCTACGDCVEACPKDLFSLHPVSHRLWVACKNLEHGDDILEDCQVGCTACGRCAQDAPGLIRMENNLAVVDYDGKHDTQVPIQRCPTGAIVWMDARQGAVKGPAALKVVRRGARWDAAT
jgi:Na+-translocating ferredoxin:NAD+ oxidoreductase RNF subunit RnfB